MLSRSAILAILATVIASACMAPATPADKQAIESLISAFNAAVKVNDFERLTALFTKDAGCAEGSAAAVPVATAIRQFLPKRLPWDERTALTMKIEKITFSSAGRAAVEAVQSDYAPTVGISRKWSCHFVVVLTGQTWRIASYRESVLPGR